MTTQRDILQLDLLADLKDCPPSPGVRVFLTGRSSLGDNLGGFYYWDALANGAEDTPFMNLIASNRSATGRWRRIFSKVSTYPHGVMVNQGGVKTFYTSGVTDPSGTIAVNLTDDDTAAGKALFSEIWKNFSRSTQAASGPSAAVTSYVRSLSADLRATTHGFFRANPVTISLGLVYAPFAAVGAGVPVQFEVTGI